MGRFVDGIPERIEHAQLVEALTGLGFEIKVLRSVEFVLEGAIATVMHRRDGSMGYEARSDVDEVITSKVFIPVVGRKFLGGEEPFVPPTFVGE